MGAARCRSFFYFLYQMRISMKQSLKHLAEFRGNPMNWLAAVVFFSPAFFLTLKGTATFVVVRLLRPLDITLLPEGQNFGR